MSQKPRLHHLDAARSFLMLFGIPYHTALIYAPDAHWRVASPDVNGALGLLAELLHAFRMPCFFILAGLLVPAVLSRIGAGRFVATRARRLLLPLATAALTVGILQVYLVYGLAAGEANFLRFAASDAFVTAWRSGAWVLHLWFLIDLFLYCAIAAAGFALLQALGVHGLAERVAGAVPDTLRSPLPLLALAAAYSVGVSGLSRAVPALDGYMLFGTVEIQRFLFNLPFFLGGLLLGRLPKAFDRLSGPSPLSVLAAAAAIAAFLLLPDTTSVAGKFAHHALRGIAAWMGCHLVLSFARSVFAAPNATVQRFTAAAFTVYLLHHPIVLAGGLLMLGIGLPPLAEFAAIALVAVAVPFAIHFLLIERYALLRLLFNGADGPRRGAPAGAATASTAAAASPAASPDPVVTRAS
ncbi:acyltransferase family protein [Arenibaculum pallidiluteum]|uniref:acyltransferase family protein n=1 Tax=Arenibaculum pallidiluteum TaxID=2812559 RepID=UPI001A96E0EF|nr:acyltransferase family protein [Arenibaculum pallidiluteum]